jgi:hypothetical protein
LIEFGNGEHHRRDVYYTSDVPLLQPARTWVRKPRPPAPSNRGSFVELGGGDRDARDLEFDPLAGSRLVTAGFDVRIPRRLIAEGRLLSWKQLCEDTATAPSVGHAAAGWDPDGTGVARLEVIGTLAGVPDGAAQQLVAAVCRDAADAGAATIVTDVVGPATAAAGFVDLPDGAGRHLDLRAG